MKFNGQCKSLRERKRQKKCTIIGELRKSVRTSNLVLDLKLEGVSVRPKCKRDKGRST
jgi:hypothetical protein